MTTSQLPPDPPGFTTLPGASGGASGGVKALVAVVVLVIVAGGAFLVLGGDDDASDPARAVREFFAAAEDRDCQRLLGLVSEASWSQNGTVDREGALEQCATEVQDDDFLPAGLRIESVEATEQTGDTAEVAVTSVSDAEGEQTETIPVVREGGRWVLDFALQLEVPED